MYVRRREPPCSLQLCWERFQQLTTWWQLNSFITEASFRNSIRSRMLADSLTVLIATLVSGSSFTTPFAIPSYTIPKEPCPNSRHMVIFSLGTSHSSGTYTANCKRILVLCAAVICSLSSNRIHLTSYLPPNILQNSDFHSISKLPPKIITSIITHLFLMLMQYSSPRL